MSGGGTRIILWASESVHQVTGGQLQSQKYYCYCKLLASLKPEILGLHTLDMSLHEYIDDISH